MDTHEPFVENVDLNQSISTSSESNVSFVTKNPYSENTIPIENVFYQHGDDYKIVGDNDINLVNDIFRLIQNVLKYIDNLKNNIEVPVLEESSNVVVNKKERALKAESNKKEDLSTKERKCLGTRVVVLAPKKSKCISDSEKVREWQYQENSGPRVCFGVRAHERTYLSDRYTNVKGQTVIVKAHSRGLSSNYRVATIYQVGDR